MRALTRVALCAFFAAPLVAAASCSSDSETGGSGNSGTTVSTSSNPTTTASGGSGTGGTGTAGTTSTSTSTSTSTASGGGGPCQIATCQGHTYLCGDCIDNDGDGKIDAEDPDCLGPCDNTEDSFYGGIPGQGGPGCDVDCYFDQDSGHGNDDCYWNHICDSLEVAPAYNPEGWLGDKCAYNPNFKITPTLSCAEAMMTQSQTCLNYCGPLTPNGCDCFGCCDLGGNGNYVFLGSEDGSGNGTCKLGLEGDPTKCEPCTPVAACLNGCGHCELCIGKTTLPPDCATDGGTTTTDGGTTSQCPSGVQPCGLTGELPCASGYYCITGCCQPLPP